MLSPVQVYETMCGLLEDHFCVDSVSNEFVPGKPCAQLQDEIYEARQRLVQRYHIPWEDRDLEIIISSFLKQERELCIKMFKYGYEFSNSENLSHNE